ncbi:hypothetical protein [Brucella pseudogrignonensis]|uniref:hypothetical protein n=1 Tax=Brucella pseudogrignonensis TaxID=419475 RepID=UPI003ECF6DCB
MVNADEIFAIDFNKLVRASNDASLETLLDAAASLRKLLMDAKPLVHRINRKHQIQLSFPVDNRSDKIWDAMPVKPVYMSSGTGFLPERSQRVSLDNFLRSELIRVSEGKITIGEYIKFIANNKGAIHFDENIKSDKLNSASAIGSTFLIGSAIPLPLYHMKNISRAAVIGLTPLYETVTLRTVKSS